MPCTGSSEVGSRAYRCVDVKQRVYFFLWGMTTEISFISNKTGSFPLAGALAASSELLLAPFGALLVASVSSRRRFFAAGSGDC
jgi:hypothetical protein